MDRSDTGRSIGEESMKFGAGIRENGGMHVAQYTIYTCSACMYEYETTLCPCIDWRPYVIHENYDMIDIRSIIKE
jgi:hypothetical protein